MECPICLDEIEGQSITMHCCKKQFHAECYFKAIQATPTCPMCRAPHISICIEPEVPIVNSSLLIRKLSLYVSSFTAGVLIFIIARNFNKGF